MNYRTIRACSMYEPPLESNGGKPHLVITGSGEIGSRVKRFLSSNGYAYSSFGIDGTNMIGIHVLFENAQELEGFYQKWDEACKKDSRKLDEMLGKN